MKAIGTWGCDCLVWAYCLFSIPATFAEEPLKRYAYREPQMGVDTQITLYAPSESVANDAARKAFERIAALNAILSDYDENSEVSRLCRSAKPGEWQSVSPELSFVLSKSLELSRQTEGAFDVTLGPVIDLWRRARRVKKLPDPQQIEQAQKRIGHRLVELQADPPRVKFAKSDLRLDFGGIAKGYAADEVLKTLKAAGIERALVALAGDIAASGPPPDAPGWKIGVAPLDPGEAPPSRYLKLVNGGVSTSGDAFQFVQIGGKRYSHIVNPTTGVGLTQRCSVTVVGPTGIDADRWATTACILGPEKGMTFLHEVAKTSGLFVFVDEGTTLLRRSSDIDRWEWPATAE